MALPGGCDFGSRPIDQHEKAFRALGADVKLEYGMIHANADALVGTGVYFDVISVGATINAILAAVKAEGNTVSFLYSGAPGQLLSCLASLPVTDVSIAEPDLEEIFLHYYSKEGQV